MEEILLAFLAKTLNKSNEEVATLIQNDDEEKTLKDGALDILLGLDAARVTELKGKSGNTKESFDNGYKKATKEIASKKDSEIKEHYGITTDLTGLELVGEVLSSKIKSLENKEITPDEVKKSVTYQTAIQNLNSQNDIKITELNESHTKELNGYKRKESMVSVLRSADHLIDSDIKPIWSKDSVRAMNQRKMIHNNITSGNFKENPGGMPIMLDEDGKALEDKHGNPISFKEFVTNNVTSLLDLQVSTPRESGGGNADSGANNAGADGFNWNGVKPKDSSEFAKLVSEAGSTKEKEAILKSYREVQND